jgi:hypothetical protein
MNKISENEMAKLKKDTESVGQEVKKITDSLFEYIIRLEERIARLEAR